MGDKTAKEEKYTKDSAADMSRLFILKNVEIEYVDPVDSEVGQKDPDGPIGNPSPNTMLVHKTLTSRWVYIFQSLADKITWYAEYWLDEKGLVHPVIDSVFPIEQIQDAHRRLESNETFGKVVLTLPDSS